MGDSPDFLSEFHNLKGDTINERKKNFYKLITRPSLFSNEEQLNDNLKKLAPRNYQESVFRIEALIYFKRTDELLEILKEGNPVFAAKVLKEPWFFKDAFKNIEPHKLVSDFLPHVSYITRKKLLSRISKCWEEEKMDELYTALYNRYGLAVAVDILHKCSPGKIKSCLEENEIKLRTNQVIELYKKSKDTFKIFLSRFHQITKTKYAERKVTDYIALKDPQFLLELEKNEELAINKIGRRTTKNIIKLDKANISTDAKRYAKFLNKAVLVRKSTPDFKSVYKQVFPEKFSEVSWCNCSLVGHYPKKRRWDLFFATCREKFPNKALSNILSSFDDRIKNLHPPQEIMHQWAEKLYELNDNNEDYLKYYPVSIAIPMIKEKINCTSDKSKRSTLQQLLLTTCFEHNDMKTLEDVLKYISERFRNEDSSIRNDILTTFVHNKKMSDLNETHWKYINEQIQLLRIKKDIRFFWLSELIQKNLEFLIKNGKDHKALLACFMMDLKEYVFYSLDLKNPPIEKQIYMEMCRTFPSVIKNDFSEYNYVFNSFILRYIDFSVKNKSHPINLSEYPYIVSYVKDNFKKVMDVDNTKDILAQVLIYNENYPQYAIFIENSEILERFSSITKKLKGVSWFSQVFESLFKKKNRSKTGQELFKYYFENLFLEYPEADVVEWFLKHEPQAVKPFFETILKGSSKFYYRLDKRLLRINSHVGYDKKALEFFKQELSIIDKKDSYMVARLFEILVVLIPINDFINIIEERFLPKKDKLDLEDEDMRELYRIQCELAKQLASVSEPYKMLPTIMKFAKGDYLQSTLPALYSAFYNSPERILYSYVGELEKQAVSVRKHALFLSCAVLDKEHTTRLLKTTNQSNISSQKHLFSATLKYFLKNPSQDLFQKVIENMNTIDKNDKETLDSLRTVYIPLKYRNVYVEQCWKFFEHLESINVSSKDYLEKVLQYMAEDILITLPSEFVGCVLKQYFPIQSKKRLSRINHFVIEVLRKRKSESFENFNLVFEMILKFNRSLVHDFFYSFWLLVRSEVVERKFIDTFSHYWMKNLSFVQTMQEHIALNLIRLKLDNPDVESVAHSVVKYMDQLISELGFLVVSVFKEQLVEALRGQDLEYKLSFYLAILKYKLDSNTCVLIIQILDKFDDDAEENVKTLHNNITGILKNVDVPIVKAYCKSYFLA